MTKTTCHRDGTVTYWSVYHQRWVHRSLCVPSAEYAAMSAPERARVMRHLYDVPADEILERLRQEAGQAGDNEQVALCDRALDGDLAARLQCADTIDNAAAMLDN